MAVNDLSTITGEFYKRVGTINGFRKIPPKGLMDVVLGTYWYESTFSDPGSTVSSRVVEWQHGLAVDNYLDSISISYHGLTVYRAQVHRYDALDHIEQTFSTRTEWAFAVADLAERYDPAH